MGQVLNVTYQPPFLKLVFKYLRRLISVTSNNSLSVPRLTNNHNFYSHSGEGSHLFLEAKKDIHPLYE